MFLNIIYVYSSNIKPESGGKKSWVLIHWYLEKFEQCVSIFSSQDSELRSFFWEKLRLDNFCFEINWPLLPTLIRYFTRSESTLWLGTYISLFSKIRCSLTYLYLPKNLTSNVNAPKEENTDLHVFNLWWKNLNCRAKLIV